LSAVAPGNVENEAASLVPESSTIAASEPSINAGGKRNRLAGKEVPVPCPQDLKRHISRRSKISSHAPAASPRMISMATIHQPGTVAVEHDASRESFPYKPLNRWKQEILVIDLKPAVESAPIECHLVHTPMKKVRNLCMKLCHIPGVPQRFKSLF
jgi:hypothetical protein